MMNDNDEYFYENNNHHNSNQEQLYCRELSEAEFTAESLRYLHSIQQANMVNGTGFVSIAYLHTSLPLAPLDRSLATALRELEEGNKNVERGRLPIVGFVGVQGNRGFAMDVIPVRIDCQ